MRLLQVPLARGQCPISANLRNRFRCSRTYSWWMRILEENWKVLASFFPAGWQHMAWRSGAVERLRGFPSPEVLLRMLMLHVARGYSLRQTVVRAKLANWTDISDVALLKRLRNNEEWLRWLCIELLRENVAYRLEEATSHAIRIVDGTIVREPGKTGSQWRILYSIRLPSLVCDFFEVTATIGEGSGESLNRLPVGPHELILADAGYCSVAGLSMFGNMVLMCWFASTLRVARVRNFPHTALKTFLLHAEITHFVQSGAVRRMARCPSWSRFGVMRAVLCAVDERADCSGYNGHIGDYCAKRVRSNNEISLGREHSNWLST